MKVISVVKRSAAVIAVGATMYVGSAYAQDPVPYETLVLTGSRDCWWSGTCSSTPEIPGHVWISWGGGGWYSPVYLNGGSYGLNASNAALTDAQKDSILSLAHKYATGFKMPCQQAGEPLETYLLRAQLECRNFVTAEFPWYSRYSPVGISVTGAAALACKDKVALEANIKENVFPTCGGA